MNLTDYILEAADVTDVDMFDIEIEQTLAEIAVAEAMLDCIEKQDVLLEYNEDSAEEIITESSMLWVLEAANKYQTEINAIQQMIDLGNAEVKLVDSILKDSEKLKQMDADAKSEAYNLRKQYRQYVDDLIKIKEDLTALGRPGVEKSMKDAAKRSEKRAEKLKQAKEKSSKIKDLSSMLEKIGVVPTGKFASRVAKVDDRIAKAMNVVDEIGNEGKQAKNTFAGAGEEYKNRMKDSASGFKGSVKGAMNATGAFLTKIALGLRTLIANVLALIFATKFDNLATKLEQMEIENIEMSSLEAGYLLRIGAVLKQLIPEFDKNIVQPLSGMVKPEQYNSIDKACVAINGKIDSLKSGFKEFKKNDASSTKGAVTKDVLIDICHTLGNGEMKRTMNNIRFMIGKWNLEFEGVPKKTAITVRKTFNKLNHYFGVATRGMSKVYKIAKRENAVNKDIDVSNMDVIDKDYFDDISTSPISYDENPKKSKKSKKKAKTDENGNVTEEFYSMDLSEDEDFF